MKIRQVTLLLIFVILAAIFVYVLSRGSILTKVNNTVDLPSNTTEVVNFSEAVRKISTDFSDIPHTISTPYKGFVRADKGKVLDVMWTSINFSSEFVNDTDFRERIEKYFLNSSSVVGYADEVVTLYGIKCELEKSGKDGFNTENLNALGINCFELVN